ncbi:AraC family transcriptional regulator [Bacillus pseudomycoides]|uniref:AraC family transcriptional regulator n=1 Tax=Bacillus pseudomycoides TaxID=64104 RepID=A0AA91VDJ1_9BACI|nr:MULTISPECIES: AraC family transcriptional regulator [Bacillus]PEB55506.1 AraC family transcriptional regulator [Bacillus sp. AFS098217]PED82160.1 AraC family transcriptional regulator [Bacillus pseudomycoides]PEU10195.1 AraC family transcriptional regulator [Bacillus sp. AFS019443]PEU19052.1 AraC family transcriptional regulator [Bacillus sp. AFS014408]PFW64667.1 AraC family transcriptional regulator [Bacillus sp. AFS075034]
MYEEYKDLIKGAVTYIEEHLDEELTTERVASYSAISMYHFHRIFQSHLGMSITDYIRKRRLTHAAQALVMTDRSVLDIAVQYGFSSQEAFTRSFKRMFHLPPKKYRTYFQSFYIEREGVSMQKGLPKGWVLSGSHPGEYEMGIDYETVHQGKTSAYIKAKEDVTHGGFTTLMQMFKADKYRGKRLRLTAFIKSKSVKDWAGLWMRVDGKDTEPLAMDNMQNRPIKNTINWEPYSVVLDIKEEAIGIAFGILLSGEGCIWADSFRLDEVDEKVPSTDLAENFYETLSEEPTNLQFEDIEE